MFDVNVQGFAPALAKSAKSGSRSKILNIGTVITGGAPWHTGYASSKVSFMLSVYEYELMERQHYKS
jgi:hypothetical protein